LTPHREASKFKRLKTMNRLFPLVSLFLILLSPLRAGEPPILWIEKPARTNFPNFATWEILSEQKAPAVMNVKDASVADSFFIEYEFFVPEPGGRYTIWGRTYDPGWSSPARWRLDEKPWQEWKPGPRADRVVALKTYVMEWHPWTEAPVELAPGSHSLRLELTGVRPHGDIPYFVLDAIVLAQGDFFPRGATKPDNIVENQH
jgi:hypothetical protein